MIIPSAHPAGHESAGGDAEAQLAGTAWNAGFGRHGGPQGRGRFVANPSGRTRSRAIPANEVVPPPACGGLCRLKPAVQAVGVAAAARGGNRPFRVGWGHAQRRCACRSETLQAGRRRGGALRRGGNCPFRVGWGRAQRGALRVPVGDRRSKPWVSPPRLSVAPRWELSFPGGVGTCAARSAARAGRRPARAAEVGTVLSGWGGDVRSAERPARARSR